MDFTGLIDVLFLSGAKEFLKRLASSQFGKLLIRKISEHVEINYLDKYDRKLLSYRGFALYLSIRM